MSWDKHSLFAYSTIATVVGQAANVLTVTVAAGDGVLFQVGQQVTIAPSGVLIKMGNGMVGRVTAISTDTLTISYASGDREGSSVQTISVGYVIGNGVTPKIFTDIESAVDTINTKLPATFGTSGQLLESQGNAVAPVWVNAPVVGVDGWIPDTDTLVYVSANSFKIVGVDQTAVYTKGTRIKCVNNSATFYGTVISSAIVVADTLVTLAPNTDYALANSAITLPFYSYQANPQGYPTWFNYTSGIAWNSGAPTTPTTVSQFSIVGSTCFYRFSQTNTGAGTTNTQADINQPVPSNISSSIYHDAGTGYVSSADNTAAPNQLNNAIYVTLFSNTLIHCIFASLSAKAVWMQGFYAF